MLFDALVKTRELSWDKETLHPLVADIWCGAEFPEQLLWQSLWIDLFQIADYSKPTEPITLYRGCPVQTGVRRMSWTTDLEQARWFAKQRGQKLRTTTAVYSVLAPPDAVLCNIDAEIDGNGRNENEIVINPRLLPKTKRLEIFDFNK